jgi:hypothetical protein
MIMDFIGALQIPRPAGLVDLHAIAFRGGKPNAHDAALYTWAFAWCRVAALCDGMHNTGMRNAIPVAAILGLGLTVLAPGPASARPRDDVLSGAFRCAGIGDSRTWLDCYYGAAQPARAALGLKPVPQSQAQLVAHPPSGSPSPGDLALRDQVLAGAVRCAGDERAWLNCFYAAAQPMRAHLGLSGGAQMPAPTRAPLTPLASAQAQQPQTGFGMRPLTVSPIGNGDHISARMQSYTFDKLGWFTVTLDNGQVWKQVNGDTTYAHWKKPAGGYQVRVSKGFLGSYNLQVKG